MALLDLAIPLAGLPQGIATPHPRWLDLGLKSAYLLQPGIWQINLVTGEIGGTLEGTGVTFVGRKLRTPGVMVSNGGVFLEHGLALNIALPITLVVGWVRNSASGVSWSLLRTDSSQWTGWYGESTGLVKSSNANSFDGALALTGASSVAFSHRSATDLSGYGNRTGKLSDATAAVPVSIASASAFLGYSKKSTADNPAEADFTHFYAFQGALTDSELLELANTPEALFEPQRIYIPVAAAGGAPAESGGASAAVTVTGAGAGSATEAASGGTSASVAATAAGAGTAAESASGGAGSTVTVSAAGAGTAADGATGGSSASVAVSAVGAGAATEAASGGASASVSVSAAGAGSQAGAESGGSVATVTTTAAGAGSAAEQASGGAAATVVVTAVGGSIAPGPVAIPAARTLRIASESRCLSIAAEHRVITIVHENRTLRIQS